MTNQHITSLGGSVSLLLGFKALCKGSNPMGISGGLPRRTLKNGNSGLCNLVVFNSFRDASYPDLAATSAVVQILHMSLDVSELGVLGVRRGL